MKGNFAPWSLYGPNEITETTVNPCPNTVSEGQNQSSTAQGHVILKLMKRQGGVEPAQLPKAAPEVQVDQQAWPSHGWVCCPLVATVSFSLHIKNQNAVQNARTSRSATRSNSKNFPVSCHPCIVPGQEHWARKGCRLENHVAFSLYSAFSPSTLSTHDTQKIPLDRTEDGPMCPPHCV